MAEGSVQRKVVMAIGAHPDDIEFMMAGTLLLLQKQGWEIHYMNLSSGNCGSAEMSGQTTTLVRAGEARRAAEVLGATWHGSIGQDIELVYGVPLLRKLVSVVRKVNPGVVLTHSPSDYMEDHTETCRLAVSAAFSKRVPNFRSDPPVQYAGEDVVVYHGMPNGLRDPLRKRVIPGAFVDTGAVMGEKRRALESHESQRAWLDSTQREGSYVETMEMFSRELGAISGRFEHAEGWRRHLHWGFAMADSDPLAEALGDHYLVNEGYEADLG